MEPDDDLNVLAVGVDPGELPGCRVEPADDLLGALARLAGGGIDVVLLSLDLPDGRGAEVVRSLRERAPLVPVVALAAGETEEAVAVDAGARDALPSDAGPELVRRAIMYARSVARLEDEIQRLRCVDELTGLLTAGGLERIAVHHLRMADRSGQPVVLVLVRLEGPDGAEVETAAGECAEFVAETADVLRRSVRESDVLARVGGGTFCALLTGDAAGAESLVLSRLVEAVAASNARSGRHERMWLSVGTATYEPERPVPFEELMREAQRRLGRPGARG